MSWAPEHDKLLREMHRAGEPFSAIAEAINMQFRTSYSRNAVIGRAGRLKLPQKSLERVTSVARKPEAAPKPRPAPASQPAPRSPKPRSRPVTDFRRHGPALPPTPVCETVTAPEPFTLTLLDLPHDGCRFPSGEGAGIRFCGAQQATGSSYCGKHQRIALSAEGRVQLATKGRAA